MNVIAPHTFDTAAMSLDIAGLSALPIGPGYDPAAHEWVRGTLGDNPLAVAASASAVSRLPEAMLALLHAYFLYSVWPSTAGLECIIDASRDVLRGRQLADVAGSA